MTLIAKSVQAPPGGSANIQLNSQDEVPQDAKLTFSVRAQSPAIFTRDQKIEVGSLGLEQAFLAITAEDDRANSTVQPQEA